jgi:hypothetical protein
MLGVPLELAWHSALGGGLGVRLMSLTEKGNENHSQAKAKGTAPVVGAGLEHQWMVTVAVPLIGTPSL